MSKKDQLKKKIEEDLAKKQEYLDLCEKYNETPDLNYVAYSSRYHHELIFWLKDQEVDPTNKIAIRLVKDLLELKRKVDNMPSWI